MKNCIAAILCLLVVASASAREKKRDLGRLSGSIETSWGVYVDDPALSTPLTQRYGTNTYVNLGYTIKGFRAGLQYDIYEPQMLGYDPELEGNGLKGFYAGWADSKWDVTLGTFYGQFGSGMLFRAFEQRDMGINTSVLGASVRWNPLPWLTATVMGGLPRRYMEMFNPSAVYGADFELSLLEPFVPDTDAVLMLGGSWLLRDDRTDLTSEVRVETAPRTVNSFSGRLAFSKGCFSFDGEYVHKGRSYGLDPRLEQFAFVRPGQALLLNMDIALPVFSASIVWRSIENMSMWQDDSHTTSVNLNYLPSLTKQHKYALFQLYPHEVHDFGGETGGSIDMAGSIPVGGNPRRPLRYSVNASVFWDMEYGPDGYRFMGTGGGLLWAEAYLELEKKWGPDWKTVVAAGWQRKPEVSRLGYGEVMMNTVSAVADVLWQISSRYSLRMELQHAWSDFVDDQGWVMGLLEFGIAPGFMFYVSDMLNYRTNALSNTHYYDAGVSYAWKFLRTSVSYGRHRAGETCSGGICRYVPEYTGVNARLSIIL